MRLINWPTKIYASTEKIKTSTWDFFTPKIIIWFSTKVMQTQTLSPFQPLPLCNNSYPPCYGPVNSKQHVSFQLIMHKFLLFSVFILEACKPQFLHNPGQNIYFQPHKPMFSQTYMPSTVSWAKKKNPSKISDLIFQNRSRDYKPGTSFTNSWIVHPLLTRWRTAVSERLQTIQTFLPSSNTASSG